MRRSDRFLLWAMGGLFLVAALSIPQVIPGRIPGTVPDSPDYAYGAEALLRGQYIVSWVGSVAHMPPAPWPPWIEREVALYLSGEPRIPRYPPGFSLLLTPAVALGGVEAAVWVPFLSAIVLGCLAIFLAWKMGPPIAALLALAAVILNGSTLLLSRWVMTEMPTAAILMLEVVLLALGRRPWAVGLAGLLGGWLVWMRVANGVLLLAGPLALTALPRWRTLAVVYSLSALIPLVGLGLWQFATYGSPFTTGYQATKMSPEASNEMGSFFSVRYLFGPPFQSDALAPVRVGTGDLPNPVLYGLELLGMQSFVLLPGAGVFGLIGLVWLARAGGARGVIGRFGLVAIVATLAVYLPYFYQSWRFLVPPMAVMGVGAAVLGGHVLEVVWQWFSDRRRTPVPDPSPP